MNTLQATKIAIQVIDSAMIVGEVAYDYAQPRLERLSAILQDQARQDLMIARDRLMFDARNLGAAIAQEFEYIVDDLAVDAREIIAALLVLPSIFYFIQQLDHEIPVYLEAPLKPMGLVEPEVLQITAPVVAGLLPPASSPVVELPAQPSEVPAFDASAEGAASDETVGVELVEILSVAFTAIPSARLALPDGWDRDRNGRKLAGAALQARMRKYQLSAV